MCDDIIIQMQVRQWVKNHKKEFANKFIRESNAKPNIEEPSCIFMAGLPGAGKTEFSKMIVAELPEPIIRIDMDEIASMIDSYKPEKADFFREGATNLQNEIFNRCKKGCYPFIMDGTLSSEKPLNCIRSAIRKGYKVSVVYILQDPVIAWRNSREREKIERRRIDLDGFIASYSKTINNLILLRDDDRIDISIIVKNKNSKTIERINVSSQEQFDKYVKIQYSNEQLRKVLSNE